MSKKPYRCVYCGRRFKEPTAHKCKDGFRKRNLKFEYTPTEKEAKRLEEAAKSFFEELDNVTPDPAKVRYQLLYSNIKGLNHFMESALPKNLSELPPIPEKGVKEERFYEPPVALDSAKTKAFFAGFKCAMECMPNIESTPKAHRIFSQDEFLSKHCPDEHDVHGIAASPLDSQVGGDHYKKYKIQPIEFAMANGLNACQTNILKYIMRYKDKDGKKDLEKARHYIDILIQTEYPNE